VLEKWQCPLLAHLSSFGETCMAHGLPLCFARISR
jgi:hypothetical protein